MTPRIKKMLGALFICVFVLMWIVLGVSLSVLVPRHPAAEFAFYAVMGVGWAFPIMPVLKWMEKSPG
jgi:hypothetical protein